MAHGQVVPPASDDDASLPAFLSGGGEMGARIRAFARQANVLGTPQQWPNGLRTVLRIALSTQHPVFIFWGPQHLCFYNDAYSTSLGPEKHPGILGMPGTEAWPEIWPVIGPQIEQVMSGGAATWHENHFVPILRHGRIDDVYWTYSYGPIDDPGAPNGIGGVLVLCTETTRQVLAERRASDERARLKAMFEQAPSFVAMLNGPAHRYEFVNAAYRRLVGHREFVGRTVAEVLPEAVEQGYVALLDQVYRSGAPHRADGAKFRLDGREIQIDLVFQPMHDAAGTITGIFVEGNDVSERVAAEAALREREATLRRVQSIGRIGSLTFAPAEGRARYTPEYLALHGLPSTHPGETREEWLVRVHPEDRAVADRDLAAALSGVTTRYESEYRIIWPNDGSTHWIVAHGEVERDLLTGEAVRLFVTQYDVTAQRSAEHKLRLLNETLEARVQEEIVKREEAQARLAHAQRMEALGQLAGGIAHDFNNILQTVSSAARLIQAKSADAARVRRLGEMVAEAVRRGAAVTSRLLAFSRRAELRAERVDAAALLADLADVLSHSMGDGIDVVVDASSELPALVADKSQLETVLVNLAANARDAMAGQGRILLSADAVTLSADGPLALSAGRYVRIAIHDTGCGIPADKLARVTEPFFTTKPKGQGTGLGLAMASGFAEQSGGALRIESTPGIGTTVLIWLPVVPASSTLTLQEVRSGANGTSRSMEILLVDDDPLVRDLTAEELRLAGGHVTAVASAGEALALLDAGMPVEALVSDISMPGVDGLMLLREVRVRRPLLPAILFSGFAADEIEADLRSGFKDQVVLLRKPVDARVLVEQLAGLLDRMDHHAGRRVDPSK